MKSGSRKMAGRGRGFGLGRQIFGGECELSLSHLVQELVDLIRDPSKTMIVEIPDSACQGACESKHFKDFLDARKAFLTHCGAPTKKFKRVDPPVRVTVTGVGFFDPPGHGTGSASNGIELHPVLKIEFDPDTDDCKMRAKPVS